MRERQRKEKAKEIALKRIQRKMPKGQRKRLGHRPAAMPSRGIPKEEIGEEEKPLISEEELKGLSVEDLFKEGAKPAKKEELELFDVEKKEIGEKMCPNCKAAGEKILYCPGCGSAFCKRCAKGTKTIGMEVRHLCPACGKEVRS